MTRPFIPFLAFLILLLLTIPFSFDFATSAVPGWHTTVYPTYFIWWLVVMIALLLVTIGYWLLSRKADGISWILFALHFALTIPTIIYLHFPSIFLEPDMTNQGELMEAIAFRLRLVPAAWTLFIIGQILFLIYYTRVVRTKRR